MKLNNEELLVIKAVKYHPSVSVLLSFEPTISLKTESQHQLKVIEDKVKRELEKTYSEHLWKPVYGKLKNAVAELDYKSARKSVAIYVSPLLSKVFYLDIPVEDKIIIDDSFEVRDLVYAAKRISKAILLLLTAKHAKAFITDNGHLLPLKLSHSDNAEYSNDPAAAVANFSDASAMKELHAEKFLKGIDESLTEILKTYRLPVFLMGTEKLLGHFGRITENKQGIADVIHGNYEESSESEISKVFKPRMDKYREDASAEVLKQLEHALSADKLEIGVNAVWTAATRGLGKVLVVQRDFMCPADHTDTEDHIQTHEGNSPMPFYIKDAVDDIIQKVIEFGGEVFFIDTMPEEYQYIALIRYY